MITLGEIQKKRILIFAFVGFVILFLIILIISLLLSQRQKPLPKREIPISFKEQPIKEGELDKQHPLSQAARDGLSLLKPDLPHAETIPSTTGRGVRYLIRFTEGNDYTTFIDILGVEFQIPETHPDFPKTVLEFRGAANAAFSWIKDRGVNPNNLLIAWGDKRYIQERSEAWLVPSPQYPEVIFKDGQWIFKQE